MLIKEYLTKEQLEELDKKIEDILEYSIEENETTNNTFKK